MYERILSLTWRWFWETVREGVSCITFWTCANRRVINDAAMSTCAARARTWVPALLPHTSQIAGTFRVDGTLRSAVGR